MDDSGRDMLVCSYSIPIHDHMGRKVGVFGADISLDWLHRQLTAIDKEYSLIKAFMEDKKKANTLSIFSSSIIIDSVGTIIAHYDKKRILKDNFYDSLRQQKDPASLQLLKNMKAGKSGIDKSDCRRADTLRVLCTAGTNRMDDGYSRSETHHLTTRLLAESESEPQRIVARMNDMMTRDNSMTIFVTFFAGVFNLDTGHPWYCNAGHKAPFMLSNNDPCSTLNVNRQLPVGAMPDVVYLQQETTLAPCTTLFLYTDGLDEAENAQSQMFGKERIKEVLQTTSPEPQTLISQMTQAVADFVGDTEQSDDLTMLALHYM